MLGQTKLIRMKKSSYAGPRLIIERDRIGAVPAAEAAELIRLGYAVEATAAEAKLQRQQDHEAMRGNSAP